MSTWCIGGARPKQRQNRNATRWGYNEPVGLDPGFVSRHSIVVANGHEVCEGQAAGWNDLRPLLQSSADHRRQQGERTDLALDLPLTDEDDMAPLIQRLRDATMATNRLVTAVKPVQGFVSSTTSRCVPQNASNRAIDFAQQECFTSNATKPLCSHYTRRCLVRFPCCERFYPCHKCHNESVDCTEDQLQARSATHMKCTICTLEQEINGDSHRCVCCNSKMSDYFCAICKHFEAEKNAPFHCDKCGICRLKANEAFHCDICNVCIHQRLKDKHQCRPDSGHEVCSICLDDVFRNCLALPCSHKVHGECMEAMKIQGVRNCPVCRAPLFSGIVPRS